MPAAADIALRRAIDVMKNRDTTETRIHRERAFHLVMQHPGAIEAGLALLPGPLPPRGVLAKTDLVWYAVSHALRRLHDSRIATRDDRGPNRAEYSVEEEWRPAFGAIQARLAAGTPIIEERRFHEALCVSFLINALLFIHEKGAATPTVIGPAIGISRARASQILAPLGPSRGPEWLQVKRGGPGANFRECYYSLDPASPWHEPLLEVLARVSKPRR